MSDAYRVLGVTPVASHQEILERYRYLASIYHPDRVNRLEFKLKAEEDMKAINEAYRALTRPENSAASMSVKTILREQPAYERSGKMPPPYYQARREYLKHQPIRVQTTPAAAKPGLTIFILFFAVFMLLAIILQSNVNLVQVMGVVLIALTLTLSVLMRQSPPGKSHRDLKK
jgi:hypothetical protein